MANTKEPVNPFYVLVVVLGVAFVITAFAYGVMAWRATQPILRSANHEIASHQEAPASGDPKDHPLTAFLDRHGVELLVWQLVALGGATFGAMWLDGLRSRRSMPAVSVRQNHTNSARDPKSR